MDILSPLSVNESKSGLQSTLYANSKSQEGPFAAIDQEIRRRFCPVKIGLPFPPKQVRLLSSRGQLIALSTKGEAVYKSVDHLNQPDLSNARDIYNGEASIIEFLNDEEVLLVDSNSGLHIVNLLNEEVRRMSFNDIIRALAVSQRQVYVLLNSKIVVLDSDTWDVDDEHCFWEEYALHLVVKDTIAVVADIGHNISVRDLATRTDLATFTTSSECKCLVASRQFLAAANGNHIDLWEWGSWTHLRTIAGYTQSYVAIALNQDESILAAGCKDGSIHLWSLEKEYRSPVKIPGYSDMIEKVEFIGDNYIYYFSSEKSRLLVLEIPEFPFEFFFPTGLNAAQVEFIGHELMFSLEDDGLMFLEATSLEYVNRAAQGKRIIASADDGVIVITENLPGAKEFRCSKISARHSRRTTESATFSAPYREWWANVQVVRRSKAQLLIGNGNGDLLILDRNFSIERSCHVHEHEITAVICLNSDECSVSGDKKGHISMYNLEKYWSQGKFPHHRAAISALAVCSEDKTLLSGSVDGKIHVSDVKSKALIQRLAYYTQPITKLYVSRDHFMAAATDCRFTIWARKIYSVVAARTDCRTFAVSQDETLLCLVGPSGVLLTENPLTTESYYGFGSGVNQSVYFKYIQKIMRGKLMEYNPIFNDWIITPSFTNVLHFYAYYNLSRHLNAALAQHAPFCENRSGDSPLSYCIKTRSFLANDLVDFLIRRLKDNRQLSCFFDKHLLDLNKLGCERLPDLYEALFQQLHLKHLPGNCDLSVKLPIVIKTPHTFDLKVEDFMPQEKVVIGQSIIFKQFALKICLYSGSTKSIKFLRSLEACSNEELFKNEFITMVLRKKWNNLWWIPAIQGIVYFCYLLFLMLYLATELTSGLFTVTLLLSVILSGYEVLQILMMRKTYLKEVSNWIDILRGGCCLLYAFSLDSSGVSDTTDVLLVILVAISFVRGLSYFGLFKPTRYMVCLIKEVLIDMVSFAILLFYSIIAITALFLSLDYDHTDGGFWLYLQNSYTIGLGEVNVEEEFSATTLLIIAASVLNTIVMLNLLISIIGDSFDRVLQGMEQADRKMIVKILIETEMLLFWRRKLNKKNYTAACIADVMHRGGVTWEGKIRTILDELSGIKKSIIANNKQQSLNTVQGLTGRIDQELSLHSNQVQTIIDTSVQRHMQDIRDLLNPPPMSSVRSRS